MSVTTSARLFNYFLYNSDDGSTYNLKSDQAWGQAAASGGAAATATRSYGRASRRRAPRKVVFRDAGSFRTFTAPVFTTAAYNALVIGTTTLTRFLPGASTGVTYTCIKKIPEKLPTSVIGRQDLQDVLAA
ncbi:MAG TPA: hypothetical protein VKQ30_26345 [Ktedonobacterales bacterium]|nr:hypothetical protein [Ktedonobacterales bacterium]